MFGLAAGILRNVPALVYVVLPFLLIAVGLGTMGWVLVTFGLSVKLLPGCALFLLGVGIARLGARIRQTQEAEAM
ncbi:hypothetical protein [Streptomyces rhizosphaericus]|uniref:hypothetical protein n=1 Tax=Streptomyces rhizosphaericus TaxID=114699 RepID=UPI000A3C8548|nr:hypothetical protein [Streptomyces rhizosphaericus]